MEDGAFEGVRVVELAQWVFVPVAGALLADWGADVIRIEAPTGDPYRGLITQGIGAGTNGVNMSVALANRGKRSISLDIKTDGGQRVLHQLLATADVFLTNFRPGALQRLGLDAATVTERYPRIVYARGHGYGVRNIDRRLKIRYGPAYGLAYRSERGRGTWVTVRIPASDPAGPLGPGVEPGALAV